MLFGRSSSADLLRKETRCGGRAALEAHCRARTAALHASVPIAPASLSLRDGRLRHTDHSVKTWLGSASHSMRSFRRPTAVGHRADRCADVVGEVVKERIDSVFDELLRHPPGNVIVSELADPGMETNCVPFFGNEETVWPTAKDGVHRGGGEVTGKTGAPGVTAAWTRE